MNTTRHNFLKSSAVLGAAAAFPSIVPSTVLGQGGTTLPSNRATIGIIGCGSRSRSCGEYLQGDNAEIVAVCDPFLSRRQTRAKEWNVQDQYADFREVLARKDIDAVHVVTPDHWHVPISLMAARAGKDVYCEKPLGLSIEQNLAARAITEKHNRIFQYGAQQRSMQHLRMGIELVLNGHIGEVKDIYAWAPAGQSGGSTEAQPVPENVDYDLWLGPAPKAPFSEERTSNRGSWYIYD
ncbi:scyllo-inositol 2-dehydrogenase (NAD(+)) [Pontiella desulfatans]|uniref:Scyllo-inositol 2-dehydrogenase (NAD(+)) n=1 Tax=Pontiella desulfatans TaxID=2750659 RepID=A0A6C2U230_PONDE|nr:Gfo/Idh/MocA family oxidoreductase [Pontiella desulfatans]VGO14022.1 scyllo-inositol 2-dehydrogenase (NAD(+)) [Pontiella desulfatans]